MLVTYIAGLGFIFWWFFHFNHIILLSIVRVRDSTVILSLSQKSHPHALPYPCPSFEGVILGSCKTLIRFPSQLLLCPYILISSSPSFSKKRFIHSFVELNIVPDLGKRRFLEMHASRAIAFFGALITFFAGPVAAFWKVPCTSPVLHERADPIVNPGQVAGHAHTIMGGNGFGFSMDFRQARASTCTTCRVTADRSNYWVPSLYYQAQNGSFISVKQVGGALIYYL